MKKTISFLLLGLFFLSSITAQDIKTSIEVGSTVREKGFPFKVMMKDDGKYFITNYYPTPYTQKIELYRYDNDCEFEKRTVLEAAKARFLCIHSVGDHIVGFANVKVKKPAKGKVLTMYSVNKKTLELNVKPIELYNYVLDRKRAKWADARWLSTTSPDGKKIALACLLPTLEPADKEIGVIIIDDNLKIIQNKSYNIGFPGPQRFFPKQINMDNEGNVCAVVQRYGPEAKIIVFNYNKYLPNYEIEVFKFQTDGKVLNHSFETGEENINDMSAFFTKNGDVMCFGSISSENMNSARGYVYTLLNGNTFEAKKTIMEDFTEEFMLRGLNEKGAKRAKKKIKKGKSIEDWNFITHDIIQRKDGGAIVVAEFKIIVQIKEYNLSTNKTEIYYHHYIGDFFVINFNSEGDIDWISRVPKVHKGISRSAGAVVPIFSKYFILDDKLVFLFNNNPKNDEYDPESYKFWLYGQKADLIMAEMDSKGEVKYSVVINAEDLEYNMLPFPQAAYFEEDRSMIIPFHNYKNATALTKVIFKF